MNEKLLRLSELALSDPAIKARFLETRREKDPMDAFCKLACDLGIPLTIGELVGMGEEMSCNQLKSTNGGGVTPYDYFDDAYEQFFMFLGC